jgi:membrane-associated protease RseP (regulator of RpoE activity)
MISTIALALLLAGPGGPGSGASQPDWQQKTPPAPPAAPAPAEPQAATPAPAPAVPGNLWYSNSGRSYLGVDIQDVTPERVGSLKLKEERGVEVTMVDQDAPAGKAGIKEHDVIVEFNGTPVEGEEQLRRMIREIPPGRTVTLGISRDGNPMKISVQLGDRGKMVAENPRIVIPAVKPRIEIPRIEIPRVEIPGYTFQVQMYSQRLGAQTENPGRQLCEFFGVKDGDCVLIRSVEKGGAAEKAGLKAGDVIVRVDNEKLTDRSDLRHALAKYSEGGKLSLGVVRDKREQTVVVDLPKATSSGNSWRIIDLDEIRVLRDDLEDLMDQVEPQTQKARDTAALKLRQETQQLRREMQRVKIEAEKSLRENQTELRRMQKTLQKELQKEMKKQWGAMI